MLWGVGPMLPIVFLYSAYLYRIFRTDSFNVRANAYDI